MACPNAGLVGGHKNKETLETAVLGIKLLSGLRYREHVTNLYTKIRDLYEQQTCDYFLFQDK
jgi:hypothetical protein